MDLNQITIPSKDLQNSVEFYQKLGLLLIVDSIPRYARFECPDGNSTFSIHHVDELPKGKGIAVYFECKDLDEEVGTLEEKGIVFDHQLQDQAWLWREAHLRDPDGNKLVLFYAGENRKNPPWRVE